MINEITTIDALELVNTEIDFILSNIDSDKFGQFDPFTEFDVILKRNDCTRQTKYFYWLKTQVKKIKICSIYDIFTEKEIKKLLNKAEPYEKGCYDTSLKSSMYFDNIESVFGVIFFDDLVLTIGHAVNKVKLPNNEIKYFDLVSEIILNKKPDDIQFVVYKEFSDKKELGIIKKKASFFDMYPAVWFEKFVMNQ